MLAAPGLSLVSRDSWVSDWGGGVCLFCWCVAQAAGLPVLGTSLSTMAKRASTSVEGGPGSAFDLGGKLAQAGILTFGSSEYNYPSVDQKGFLPPLRELKVFCPWWFLLRGPF